MNKVLLIYMLVVLQPATSEDSGRFTGVKKGPLDSWYFDESEIFKTVEDIRNEARIRQEVPVPYYPTKESDCMNKTLVDLMDLRRFDTTGEGRFAFDRHCLCILIISRWSP